MTKHKHSLMGKQPREHTVRETEESIVDVVDGRTPGGSKAWGVPSYEEKMKQWYETGLWPYPQSRPSYAGGDDRPGLRERFRYARARLRYAWRILRHGYDPYYDDWE